MAESPGDIAFSIIDARGDTSHLDIDGEGAAEFAAHIASVRDGMQAQHDAALVAQGVDPASFAAWAWEHKPAALRSAIWNHWETRSVFYYETLVRQFTDAQRSKASANPAPAVVNEQPPKAQDRMVRIGGLLVSEKAARRSGLM